MTPPLSLSVLRYPLGKPLRLRLGKAGSTALTERELCLQPSVLVVRCSLKRLALLGASLRPFIFAGVTA